MINESNLTETDALYFDAEVDSTTLGITNFQRTNVSHTVGTTISMTSSTVAEDEHNPHEFDAFLYIIIVLSFYALSMVLLMIKYIRTEEEEISLDYYYDEFVKREKFESNRLRNMEALERTRRFIEQRGHLFGNMAANATSNEDTPSTSVSETTFCLTTCNCRETTV